MKIKFTLGLISHNDKLDEDHHRLFDEANIVIEKIEKNSIKQKDIKEILRYLKTYSITHFDLEENLMKINGYYDIKKHRELHKKIAIEFDEMIKDFKDNGLTEIFIQDLKLNLIELLYSHIKIEDQKFIEYLHISSQMDNML